MYAVSANVNRECGCVPNCGKAQSFIHESHDHRRGRPRGGACGTQPAGRDERGERGKCITRKGRRPLSRSRGTDDEAWRLGQASLRASMEHGAGSMEPDFPEDSGERALSARPDRIALVRRGGRPPILSGARRSIRRGAASLPGWEQTCLRTSRRASRRSRSRGIYPERPCAPVFVWLPYGRLPGGYLRPAAAGLRFADSARGPNSVALTSPVAGCRAYRLTNLKLPCGFPARREHGDEVVPKHRTTAPPHGAGIMVKRNHQRIRRRPFTESKCLSRLTTVRRCSLAMAAIQQSLAGMGVPFSLSCRLTPA